MITARCSSCGVVQVARPADCAELAELARGCADRDGPLLVHVPVTGHA